MLNKSMKEFLIIERDLEKYQSKWPKCSVPVFQFFVGFHCYLNITTPPVQDHGSPVSKLIKKSYGYMVCKITYWDLKIFPAFFRIFVLKKNGGNQSLMLTQDTLKKTK